MYDEFLTCLTICINMYTYEVYVLPLKLNKMIMLGKG